MSLPYPNNIPKQYNLLRYLYLLTITLIQRLYHNHLHKHIHLPNLILYLHYYNRNLCTTNQIMRPNKHPNHSKTILHCIFSLSLTSENIARIPPAGLALALPNIPAIFPAEEDTSNVQGT